MSQPDPTRANDPEGQEAPPVCPRHPDRVAYVRCQRCERPTCPECQVPGAVGVRCVDCARKATRSRRPVRSVLGGTPVADSAFTKGLILACVAVYIGQMVRPGLSGDLGFMPFLASKEWWRFGTTAFVHASPLHLGLNMWMLWILGNALEPVLGRWRFATLYALSTLGSSTLIYWLASPDRPASWIAITVGASGAVFGLAAAMFIVLKRFGRDTSTITGLLVVNLVFSFVGANISWQGHLGGLVTGAAVAAVYAWAPRSRRTLYGMGGSVLIAVVLVAAICARAALV